VAAGKEVVAVLHVAAEKDEIVVDHHATGDDFDL
jgi:hypothetical protein